MTNAVYHSIVDMESDAFSSMFLTLKEKFDEAFPTKHKKHPIGKTKEMQIIVKEKLWYRPYPTLRNIKCIIHILNDQVEAATDADLKNKLYYYYLHAKRIYRKKNNN